MKKTLLSILCFCMVSTFAFTQATFSDDFEAYEAGDYLAASNSEWTTWGGTVGTSEDVRITDENAASGTKSIKFVATGAGGPADVVKYFTGQKITTGVLSTSMNLLVETGAYFNYQAEVNIGDTWAMNAFFNENGVGSITSSGNEPLLSFAFPPGEWFDFSMTINLDANKWQLNVNGECVGSFANGDNSIASIDFYPVQGNSFFVDDFQYDYNPDAPEIKDDAITVLRASEESGFTDSKVQLGGTLSNGGSTMITAFEVEATVGSEVIPFSVDGLSLANGQSYDFVVGDATLSEGFSEAILKIVSINGGDFSDEDLCNDESNLFLFGTTPADNKAIIVEEATGTWCGWCPRGAVALDRFAHKYGDRFIGIAVHNGDPMVVGEYDSNLGASGYPNAFVNRNTWIDPGQVEGPFLDQVQEPSISSLIQGAAWNPDSRELRISMSVTALEALSDEHKVNVVLTEDGVTGTSSGYNQANYYAGGSDLIDINGVNWADLPSTVPAADMVYDHVARAILAPFGGMEGSFDGGLNVGDEKVHNFTYTVPEDFDIDKMHIISMVIEPDGSINSGKQNTVAEAIENGFVEVTSTHDVELTNSTSVYPNPFGNYTNVSINLSESTDVQLEVIDLTGKTMMSKMYQNQNGLFSIQVDATGLAAGTYILKISTGDKYTTQRLSVVK